MTHNDRKIIFISDVHLGGFSEVENKRIESSLIQLLDYCEAENYRICLLGDLFDYWMEYPTYVPALSEELLDRFKSYHQQIGPSLFITGNHDNWTRGHFEDLGFDVEQDYRVLSLDSQQVLLLHGDGLVDSEANITRPLLHRFLRNQAFIRLYQRIFPPKTGLLLMKYFSRMNRFFEEYRSDEEKLNKWAEFRLKQSETDVIICGHDHFPRFKEFGFGTYINLGTFYKHQSLAVYNKGEFSLVVWSDKAGELKPYNSEIETS